MVIRPKGIDFWSKVIGLSKLLTGQVTRTGGAVRAATLATLGAAIAACVAIIALGHQQIVHERRTAERNIVRDNRARVHSFEQHVLRTLAVADVTAQHVESHLLPPSSSIERNEANLSTSSHASLFSRILIHAPHLGMELNAPSSGLSATAISQLRRLATVERPLIVSPPIEIMPGMSEVALIRPNPGVRGAFVAIFINPRRFTDFADHLSFGQQDIISLVGLDGITRARRTGDRFSAGERLQGLVMERQLADPDGEYVGPSVLDGTVRFFSHQRLRDYAMFVTSGVPVSEVTARTRGRRQFHLLVMTAGVAAVLLVAALILQFLRSQQTRVAELVRANRRLNEAQRIGMIGDWDYYPDTNRLHWSEQLRRMYGRSVNQSPSRLEDVDAYVTSAQAADLRNRVAQVLATGTPSRWEVDVTLPGGTQSRRRVIAAPIRNDAGTIVGIHGTDQDVSFERSLRDMELRLGELARLDSIGMFAATLAHELNHPLGIAANYLGAALRQLPDRPDTAQSRDHVMRAHRQIEHLAELVQSARDLVSRRTGDDRSLVSEIVGEVKHLLSEAFAHRPIAFEASIAPDASAVQISPAQLKQVLFNLARNAVEATPSGRGARLLLSAESISPDTVQLTLSDNGTGFPETIEDPFAAMSTSKTTGLGLGLALSRTIIEAMGGRIWIAASTSAGSDVTFTLPAADVTTDLSDRP